jgi:uncharacterized protein
MSGVAELSDRFFDALRHRRAGEAAEGEATASGFGHLAGHSYCVVVSYKRNGDPVPTPVWFGVDDEGRLYFRSYVTGSKLRRIRNDPRVRVAPCNSRGKPLGPAAPGTARLIEGEDEHAERTIASNYGRFRRIYKQTAGNTDSVYVEVTPA